MSDLFHESVPFEWVDDILFTVMQLPQHIFMFLTKRADRMEEYFKSRIDPRTGKLVTMFRGMAVIGDAVIPNLWLGVTVENQEQDWRIKHLLNIPAAVRFVSVEPMLGPVNLKKYLWSKKQVEGTLFNTPISASAYDLAKLAGLNGIDWVIAGPETGTKARPMEFQWIENLYKQCQEVRVPFFDKRNTLGLNLQEFPEVLA
jgi:protein gp37